MKVLVPILVVFLSAGACSQGSDPSDDAGIEQDATNGGDDANDAGTDPDAQDAGADEALPDGSDSEQQDAGSDPGVDGEDGGDGDQEPQMVAVCRRTCEQAAECSGGTPGPYDEDNYACVDGICEWLGCWSDEDCQAQIGMENYVCRDGGEGYVAPSCFKTCLMVEDCTMQSPAYDEDNYACTGGLCEYTGCNNDQECRVTPNFAHYVCRSGYTLVPMCFPGCLTPADCDMGAPAYDADNYDCTDGVCIYAGCNNDEECDLSDSTHEAACR